MLTHMPETIEDLKKQLQNANDMLQMLSNQRNAAQNECVQLGAALTAVSRELEALKKAQAEPEVQAPKANGHADGAEARA